jgi:hypothetical protein
MKKFIQKVSPKKDLLQHFNNNGVPEKAGGASCLKNRTDTVSKPVSSVCIILIIDLIIS